MAKADAGGSTLSRRFFFATGLGGLLASLGAAIGGTLRFFFPKVLFEPSMTFQAGSPEEYSVGEVSAKLKDAHRVWIVRTTGGIYAVEAACTHLGCTPNWFAEERLFKCPCHGSNFNLEGDVVAGPAPEPLYRLSIKVDPFKQIVVNKAVKENAKGKREGDRFLLRV